MIRRLRVLLYCVTRVGIGHFVRTREIARAVAERHEAHLVDGAVAVPDRPMHAAIHRVEMPELIREGGQIRPLQAGATLEQVLEHRCEKLVQTVRKIRPDVVTVEHFPFSKLEHRDEIISMIQSAREVNPDVVVVCSIRDLAPEPNYRPRGNDYRRLVLETLHRWFDRLLVHADPCIVELRDSLTWAHEIQLPFEYTGFVAEPLSIAAETGVQHAGNKVPGMIIVSGGGRRDAGLYDCCVRAWQELLHRGHTGGRTLLLDAPAGIDPNEIVHPLLVRRCNNVQVRPFSRALVDRLSRADLSISLAGYNTCMNVLLTGIRSILVPNVNSADQVQRAHILERRGLCRVIDEKLLNPIRLADAIEEQLATQPAQHEIDLKGAQRSREILESWADSSKSC